MPRNSTARKRIASAPNTIDPTTERSKLARQIELIKKIREGERYNKIELYDPYPYQKRFHDTGSDCNQRLLMAGNRIGKSFSGAADTVVTAAPDNLFSLLGELSRVGGIGLIAFLALTYLIPLVMGYLIPNGFERKKSRASLLL